MMHDDSPDHDPLDRAIERGLTSLASEHPHSALYTEDVWRRIAPEVERVVNGYRPYTRPSVRSRWKLHALRALAACLLLGAITTFSRRTRVNGSRNLTQHSETQAPGPGAAGSGATRDEHLGAGSPLPQESLRQAAGLLAEVTSEQVTETDRSGSLFRKGRQLLAETRTMLDQSSQYDPTTRALLADLEYVLVQVVQGGVTDPSEHALLVSNVSRRALVPRLRGAAGRRPDMSS